MKNILCINNLCENLNIFFPIDSNMQIFISYFDLT